MVLYFTGTGNSRYVAERIAKELDDEIVSINDIIKINEVAEFHSESKPYIIVTPIYGWKIPKFIEEFLIKHKFNGSMRFYVIATCGSSTGNAYTHLLDVCVKNNLKLKGFAEVKMPDNYVLMFDVKSLDEVKDDIKASNSHIENLIDRIKNNEEFVIGSNNNIKNKLLSGVVNNVFDKAFVSAKGFHTNENCVLCGNCATNCAFNNIEIRYKVVWGDRCTHCCACIAQCPTKAIDYKKTTQKRKRYYLPENTVI